MVKSAIGFVLCVVSIALPAQATEEKKNIDKSAQELPYFRLPWMKKPYDRWSSTGVKRTKLTSRQIKALPSRVDNSKHLAWPGIGNQKKWGCCSQEGTVAGMIAYELNLLRNKSAAAASNRLPAHFSWNMFNSGKNQGAEMIHGLETVFEIGIPSEALYGGRYNAKVGYWPSGYGVWHDAMKNRVAGYDFMKVDNSQSLQLAKAWLYNHAGWFKRSRGGMLTIDGADVWHAPLQRIPPGQHEAGKKIWSDWGPEYGGHVMCVVGYDDKVGYDINEDGKITNNVDLDEDGEITIADYERGAFIVANSWGTQWGDEGMVYVLYRCLMSRRQFWDRGPFMGYAVVTSAQPRLTMRFKAIHSRRNQLGLKITISDAQGKQLTWQPQIMFNQKTGAVPLGGPGTENEVFEWGIDLTTMVATLAGENQPSLLRDLRREKASIQLMWTDKNPPKEGMVENTKEILKEVELNFWSANDKQLDSKSLIKSPLPFTKQLFIHYPAISTTR